MLNPPSWFENLPLKARNSAKPSQATSFCCRDARTVTVRAATIRPGEEQHRDFMVGEIKQLADAFNDLEVGL